MAVFRVERNKGYTVMSNHHLRNKELWQAAHCHRKSRSTATRTIIHATRAKACKTTKGGFYYGTENDRSIGI